ncbi:Cysteine/Histidine-rich C1 domain family protein [Trema orientale]|uniref:Cysteine/Histidine-rich C1 domain family protein n=1 Tax=Trema orientale TaxID=63057 RepID=A0A2P5DIY7_TREOI|nr:Cysteine/Histidine-rich C1 domain family protein [Trema orientale]
MNTNTNKALPLNKSRTFQLTKVPSMVDPPQSRHYSPSYPRSPQLIFGEEMIHFSHPRHPLSLVNLPDRFTCAGCKEYGAGKRFVCQRCDFQLHDFCGSAPPALKAHPLHCQHQLVLFSKPVKGGGVVQSKCDVCNKSIKGYAFRCSACSFQMHPCCAMLSSEMNMPRLHPHTLRLLPANNSSNDINMVCGECSRKRSAGRVYHCTVCDYHLHALCAKNHVNGLRENGHKGNDKPNSSNVLGTAARVASQVVIEFIGGLIEGLAEGVGQVIVQDVARGRSTTTSTATRGSSRQNNDTYY